MKNSLKIMLAVAISSPVVAYARHSQRVEDLISRMTVEEKIGQINQLNGEGMSTKIFEQVRNGRTGSILNEVDVKTQNALQRAAVDSTRLSIPLVFARDVIHGFKTIFPIPLGQAATWDAETVRKGAEIAADEASSSGIRWTFSPMVDISRDARWGRIAEGFGEDPYLVSLLGAAMVNGYQGDDLSRPNTMAACAKHFAGYGFVEGGMDYYSSWMAPQTVYDVVLPPFKACADAGSATFMCSYNDLNGIPGNGNKHILKEVLRDQWGWDGLLVSDWNSINQMIDQGYARDQRDAARISADCGVDIDMMSHAYIRNMKDLLDKGEITMTQLDSMVANVLTLKERLGLFENPYTDEKTAHRYYAESSLKAARDAAARSAVLLKNENNILPLAGKPGRIAVSGPLADSKHDQNGTWVFDMEKEHTVTPMSALTDRYGKKNVVNAVGLEYSRDKDADHIKRAVAAAKDADIIIYFAGEESVLTGEAHCLTDITLPGKQHEEIEALKSLGKPFVMVVMTGRPMAISKENDLADALVYYFHPGTMGGPAIVDVLSGDFNPQGRLPVSIPRTSGQQPLYYAHTNSGRPAKNFPMIDEIPREAEQMSLGNRAYFLDAGNTPLYPFGYGLSYTDFSYGDVRLSQDTMSRDGELTATVTIKNDGTREGTAVAQLYIGDKTASVVQPVRVMKGFEKISLKPGESKDVSFTINEDMLKITDSKMNHVAEPGEFRVWITKDALSGKPVVFNLVD